MEAVKLETAEFRLRQSSRHLSGRRVARQLSELQQIKVVCNVRSFFVDDQWVGAMKDTDTIRVIKSLWGAAKQIADPID
jgi:hypothetical protein